MEAAGKDESKEGTGTVSDTVSNLSSKKETQCQWGPAGKVAQAQLDAYNAHDLQAFAACFSKEVQVFKPPSPHPAVQGLDALSAFYAKERFNKPALHAELLSRIEMGGKVFDHERVTGLQEEHFEVTAVYEVTDGLITTVWMYSP